MLMNRLLRVCAKPRMAVYRGFFGDKSKGAKDAKPEDKKDGQSEDKKHEKPTE